jgi:hypothetical protein
MDVGHRPNHVKSLFFILFIPFFILYFYGMDFYMVSKLSANASVPSKIFL